MQIFKLKIIVKEIYSVFIRTLFSHFLKKPNFLVYKKVFPITYKRHAMKGFLIEHYHISQKHKTGIDFFIAS